LLANLIGPVTTPLRAILAGAIAGATLGIVQWLVLRLHHSRHILHKDGLEGNRIHNPLQLV
jgi:hypothetical protein